MVYLLTYFEALQSLKDLGRLTYRRFLELFRHMVGLLVRVVSPSQGLSTYTGQHNTERQRTNIRALNGIRTHAADRTAIVTGSVTLSYLKIGQVCSLPF
jgi:hypothetical protein